MNALSKSLLGLVLMSSVAGAELRQVVGPKMPRQQDVMVVVHGPDGSEAYREKAKSDEILVLRKWNPYLFDHAGWMGGKPSNPYPHVINGLATDGTPAQTFKLTAGLVYYLSKAADSLLPV
ncbi:hypothetical protein JST97_03040 [bacterium]|nr:hypothetical protein [bacterium]